MNKKVIAFTSDVLGNLDATGVAEAIAKKDYSYFMKSTPRSPIKRSMQQESHDSPKIMKTSSQDDLISGTQRPTDVSPPTLSTLPDPLIPKSLPPSHPHNYQSPNSYLPSQPHPRDPNFLAQSTPPPHTHTPYPSSSNGPFPGHVLSLPPPNPTPAPLQSDTMPYPLMQTPQTMLNYPYPPHYPHQGTLSPPSYSVPETYIDDTGNYNTMI